MNFDQAAWQLREHLENKDQPALDQVVVPREALRMLLDERERLDPVAARRRHERWRAHP